MTSASEGRSSPRFVTIIFRKMIEMHLLCVSGSVKETEKGSMSVKVLQSSSSMSWSTSQDPGGLSDLADTRTVGISCLDNASRSSG